MSSRTDGGIIWKLVKIDYALEKGRNGLAQVLCKQLIAELKLADELPTTVTDPRLAGHQITETCTNCGGLGKTPNHPHILAKRCERCKGSGKITRVEK